MVLAPCLRCCWCQSGVFLQSARHNLTALVTLAYVQPWFKWPLFVESYFQSADSTDFWCHIRQFHVYGDDDDDVFMPTFPWWGARLKLAYAAIKIINRSVKIQYSTIHLSPPPTPNQSGCWKPKALQIVICPWWGSHWKCPHLQFTTIIVSQTYHQVKFVEPKITWDRPRVVKAALSWGPQHKHWSSPG